MKKLKLNQLAKDEIAKHELSRITGGYLELGCNKRCKGHPGCIVEGGSLKRGHRRAYRNQSTLEMIKITKK